MADSQWGCARGGFVKVWESVRVCVVEMKAQNVEGNTWKHALSLK